MMGLPSDDWQFWVVTILAIGGVLVVIRPLVWRRRRGPCGGCGSVKPVQKKPVSLTVDGERV